MGRSVRLEPRSRFQTISGSRDVSRLFREGRFTRTKGLKLGYAENDYGYHRVAFAPTRGFGRAVDRNRQKRISREAYRQLQGEIFGAYDLVFVIYSDATNTTSERHNDMVRTLGAARLLKRPKR